MPKPIFIPCPEYPYHVSSRTNNGEWFTLPMDEVWNIMSDYLFMLHHGFAVEILAFVLMSNHFHMLARFPEANICQAMMYFLRETSKKIGKYSRKENHLWGGPFFRSRITKNHYFDHAYKYIYRNPVASGIVTLCEEYPFSTLHGLLGQKKIHIPVQEDTRLFPLVEVERTLAWINTRPNTLHSLLVKRALQRPEFEFLDNEKNYGLDHLRY